MGLAYCKSLCSGSKAKESLNNGNGLSTNNVSNSTATNRHITTIQTAVESQGENDVIR